MRKSSWVLGVAVCGTIAAGCTNWSQIKDASVAQDRARLNAEKDPDLRLVWQAGLACEEAAAPTQAGLTNAYLCSIEKNKALVADWRARAESEQDQARADRMLGVAACVELTLKPQAAAAAGLTSWAAMPACIEAHKGERPGGKTAVAAVAPAPPSPAAARPAATPVPAAQVAVALTPAAAPSPPQPPASTSSYVVAAPQPSAYALIIGIEKYRDVPSPTGARTDAEKFAKLARTTLGVPDAHIRLAVDDRATKGDIEKHLEWLKANAQPGSRIYFFFSGHGAPEPTTGTSYVLPYDGDPRFLEGTALRLTTVLGRLQETKAREVLAVLDSCFSGAGGRSVLPPGARALVRVQAPPTAARIALFSASSGTQTSGPAPNAPTEGLFTQKILEALGNGQGDMNGDGQVSLEELRDWVKPRVTRAAKVDNRDQTPELQIGNNIGAPGNFIVAWGLATKL